MTSTKASPRRLEELAAKYPDKVSLDAERGVVILRDVLFQSVWNRNRARHDLGLLERPEVQAKFHGRPIMLGHSGDLESDASLCAANRPQRDLIGAVGKVWSRPHDEPTVAGWLKMAGLYGDAVLSRFHPEVPVVVARAVDSWSGFGFSSTASYLGRTYDDFVMYLDVRHVWSLDVCDHPAHGADFWGNRHRDWPTFDQIVAEHADFRRRVRSLRLAQYRAAVA